MVLCDRVLTPEEYVKINFNTQIKLASDNQIEELELFIEAQGECLWSYPLTETEHVINEGSPIVLVDCVVLNPKTKKSEHVFRWFECVFEEKIN